MKYVCLFVLFLLCWQVSHAQRGCATEEYFLQQLEEDPGLRERMDRIERFTRRYQQSPLRSQSQVIQIPVVVHIVYKEEVQNLSLEQIESQLRILNEDFRRLNADTTLTPPVFQPIAGDIQLEFCLASVDPQGNPTTGITRTATPNTSFSPTTGIKVIPRPVSPAPLRPIPLLVTTQIMSSTRPPEGSMPGIRIPI